MGGLHEQNVPYSFVNQPLQAWECAAMSPG